MSRTTSPTIDKFYSSEAYAKLSYYHQFKIVRVIEKTVEQYGLNSNMVCTNIVRALTSYDNSHHCENCYKVIKYEEYILEKNEPYFTEPPISGYVCSGCGHQEVF